ncbi:MAG: protein kinase [Gammaproteobacteria bacterium]|nr:protein kinase [Gammaproteobacteria bacterium]
MKKPFPAYKGTQDYVFVCYAHADRNVVYPEMKWLRDQGINVWYDEGISGGTVWRSEIATAILKASRMLYYISPASLASDHCNREVIYALDKNIKLLPVYLEDVQPTGELDLALNRIQALNRDDDYYRDNLLTGLGSPAISSTGVDIEDDDATVLVEPRQQELRPGDVLRQRYVIERLLGEGAMGKVFLAVDREAEPSYPHVAIKILTGSFREHPQSAKALRREATHSRQLNHPNIVNVYGFDRDGEHVFMVMEYMRGQSLDKFIERNPQGSHLSEVWEIIKACSEALAYLHSRHIVHADFKPGNVFVTEDGDIKVLDLGIARIIDETPVAEGTTRFDPNALVAMTPLYASCEVFDGLPTNEQDDLYALGCVTYELLAGDRPYGRQTALEARANKLTPKRPKGLKTRQWHALSAALAMDRAGRQASVKDFLIEMAPKKDSATPIPWIVATAALVAGIGIAVILNRTSADDEFMDAVLIQYAGNQELPVTLDKAKNWLKQADLSLDMGKAAFERNEIESAISILRTGSSSAYFSYWLVLTRSDDTATRETAARGHLSISKAFKYAALEASEVEQRLEVACHGLLINKFEPELLKLIRAERNSASGSVEPCDELDGDLL